MTINSLILQSCKTKRNFNMYVPRVTLNNAIALSGVNKLPHIYGINKLLTHHANIVLYQACYFMVLLTVSGK